MSLIPVTLVVGDREIDRIDLLRRWLSLPACADALLLGEASVGKAVGHMRFAPVRQSGLLGAGALASACACCVPQRGLATALRESLWRFARGGVRQYARVFIDGAAADPSAVLRTLLTDEAVTAHYVLARVIAVVSAPDSASHAGGHAVDAAQAERWSMADVLAVPSTLSAAERTWLASVVPGAHVCEVAHVSPDADASVVSPAAHAWLAQAHSLDAF